jgi:hypothetical protein
MCAVSAIGDDWTRRIPGILPGWDPITTPLYPHGGFVPDPNHRIDELRNDFEELKKFVLQMREELLAAKAQDIAEGNPDCEMEEKVAFLKAFAEHFGVSLKDVFPDD